MNMGDIKQWHSDWDVVAFPGKCWYAVNVSASCVSFTQDCELQKCSLVSNVTGERPECRQNAVCNHSSTSEQQADRSTLCKPSGVVIIVWTQRRPVLVSGCTAALILPIYEHTLCVWTHKDLSKQFPLWPDSSNFTSASVLQPFLLYSDCRRYTYL